MVTVYGIPNCDTCRKARDWLEKHSIEYRFHDLRADGLEKSLLAKWARSTAWQKLLNKRSATWRGIAESVRQGIDKKRALELMLQHPTLIKRPVLDMPGTVIVGFSANTYNDILG